MSQILEGLTDKDIIDANPRDLGLVQERTCTVSGMLATDACAKDPGGYTPGIFWYREGTVPVSECKVHQIQTICLSSGKIATEYCPTDQGILETKCLLFLEHSSIYWQLTNQRRDQYLPGAVLAPADIAIYQITPDMDEYYEYFCDVHTRQWHNEQQQLQAAISAANNQISLSRSVLSDSALSMSADHRHQLSDMISELAAMVSSPVRSTAAAIEQKTLELKNLTSTLLSIYGSNDDSDTDASED